MKPENEVPWEGLLKWIVFRFCKMFLLLWKMEMQACDLIRILGEFTFFFLPSCALLALQQVGLKISQSAYLIVSGCRWLVFRLSHHLSGGLASIFDRPVFIADFLRYPNCHFLCRCNWQRRRRRFRVVVRESGIPLFLSVVDIYVFVPQNWPFHFRKQPCLTTNWAPIDQAEESSIAPDIPEVVKKPLTQVWMGRNIGPTIFLSFQWICIVVCTSSKSSW